MSIVEDCISWDGCYAEILLYALFVKDVDVIEIDLALDGYTPVKPIIPFELVDEIGRLNQSKLVLYSITLSDFPDSFDAYLKECFCRLSQAGAIAFWAMFEGGFHFDHLLTSDIAKQIYGIGIGSTQTKLALSDDEITSATWEKDVGRFRKTLIEMSLIR